MDKALIVTSVASMVDQFLLPSMFLLQKMGYEVYVACNFEKGNTCSLERVEKLKKTLDGKKIHYYQIDFDRNILRLSGNKRAYDQLVDIISSNNFKLIHCHSPIGGLLGRLAAKKARKMGTKVLYTAHGFHFYKGAPLKNWLFYYPVEKFCSYFTDVLITINNEDYILAKKKMKAKQVEYVPGIGIDLSELKNVRIDRKEKRREIGVPENAILLFSVGELNKNKNHQLVIKALAELNDPSVHYAIAGIGDQKEYLLNLAEELGISQQVHLLGYREDIAELNHTADVFCFPSIREGLSVALMEAMACGLPVVCSKIRGNIDLIDMSEDVLFDPYDVDSCKKAIDSINWLDINKLKYYNQVKVKMYEKNQVMISLQKIFEGEKSESITFVEF